MENLIIRLDALERQVHSNKDQLDALGVKLRNVRKYVGDTAKKVEESLVSIEASENAVRQFIQDVQEMLGNEGDPE